MSGQSLSIEELHARLHEALRLWHKGSSAGDPLASLQLVQAARQAGDSIRHAHNRVLLDALARLDLLHPQEADLLRRRFLDSQMVHVIANSLNVAVSTVHTRQRAALSHLAEVVRAMEDEARTSRQSNVAERLPPATYGTLVGGKERLLPVREILVPEGAPWIVVLQGIGGIGKTSLADALVRQIMQEGRFADVGWVSAQRTFLDLGGAIREVDDPALTVEALVDRLGSQLLGEAFTAPEVPNKQKFAALQGRLKEQPHLIVVDNLETLSDLEALVPALQQLADPSKFLLTSRQSLYPQPQLWPVDVPPLSETHALQLVRQAAHYARLPALQEAADDALLPIYQLAGGNPLALRLIVGQIHFHGLDAVLADLQTARGMPAEGLYTFIYRQAWDSLDETARRVLLAMPLVSDQGGDLSLLLGTSQLDAETVRPALERLVMLNLVDARGGLHVRRYTIHNLTRTFLQEQVIRWL